MPTTRPTGCARATTSPGPEASASPPVPHAMARIPAENSSGRPAPKSRPSSRICPMDLSSRPNTFTAVSSSVAGTLGRGSGGDGGPAAGPAAVVPLVVDVAGVHRGPTRAGVDERRQHDEDHGDHDRAENPAAQAADDVSAARPWGGAMSIRPLPRVRMIRQPPKNVPSEIASAQTSLTQNGMVVVEVQWPDPI